MAIIEKTNVTEKATESMGEKVAEKAGAPSIKNLFMKYGSGVSLSTEATDYLKRLRELLEDPSNRVKIVAKKITRPSNAILFASENYGVILIFDDHTSDVIAILKNTIISTAVRDCSENYPNIKILNCVVLNQFDYHKYQVMANYINTLLMMYEDHQHETITIDSFTNNNTFVIETDINVVRERFSATYPHGVIPRCDIGFICYISNKNDLFRTQQHEYIQKDELFSVVGYTEIVPNSIGPQDIKLTPVIHITGVSCPIWSTRLLPLALGISAEVFGAYELWKSPYRSISKNSVNLGNLRIDPKTNTPQEFKNEGELEFFLNNSFTPPVVVTDVTEGVTRVPGIAMLSNPMFHQALSMEISKFFGMDNQNINLVAGSPTQEAIGYAKIKNLGYGEIIDSRYIDYLNMVKTVGYDEHVSKLFLKYSLDPLKKIELIRKIVPDVKFTHLNLNVILEGKTVAGVVETLSHHVNIVNPLTNQLSLNVDVKSLLNNVYSSGPTIGRQRGTIPSPILGNYSIV